MQQMVVMKENMFIKMFEHFTKLPKYKDKNINYLIFFHLILKYFCFFMCQAATKKSEHNVQK